MNRMPPAMHVSDVISNQGGKTYRTVLIRSSYRDRNGRSQKKTIANISHLPEPLIELIRNHFSGTRLTQAEDSFEIFKNRKHGAVQAVMTAFDSFFQLHGYEIRCMVLRYSRFSLSPRSAIQKNRSDSSSAWKLMPCLLHLTETPGSVDAIMRSC